MTQHEHHGEHSMPGMAHAGPDGHEHRTPSANAAHAGHDKHAGHSVAMFRDRFWISLALTVPTLIWGHMLESAVGLHAPQFPGSQWIPPLFGAVTFLYGGRPFLQGAVREVRDRLPGMMTLITLAISVAFLFSAAVTLGFPGMPLWEELATLVTIMLLGHWMEMRSVSQAQGALKELAKLLPSHAIRIHGEATEEVAIDALVVGDLVLIRPGASIPADGLVKDGASAVNESMLTGESVPAKKGVGDKVVAGTVNGSGSLRVEVTGTGDRTALAGIMRLVAEAQSSRSKAQDLADRAAFALTIIAVTVGITTLIAWLIIRRDTAFAIERMVTVLVIACPHALGLAMPLVIAISTTLGARNGLLVRKRRGLEEARNLDIVVMDKTGTLTRGEFGVVQVGVVQGLTDVQALSIAAAVEADSEHPVAQGILKGAEERNAPKLSATGFTSIAGKGVQAAIDGRKWTLGGPALLREQNWTVPASLQPMADAASQRGQAVVYLADESGPQALFAVADLIRPESADAIKSLHDLGLQVVMMTGDAKVVAEAVAAELKIDQVFAEVLPEQKSSKIDELKKSGKKVAMVGDGVNDAPALLTADVGVAIGAGTDVAVEAGDIVLVRSDPRDIARIIRLSRASYRKMVQNLWLACGYNIVAIPLAAGVLASRGIILSPAIGAVLMSLSTVVVALNAQLLRRAEL
jgi:P-type Cu2+ transporter